MSQTLKSRISVIILMALLLTSLAGTMCYAAEASTPTEGTKQAVEVKLNRKVFFTGKTYWRMDGKGKARREYKDGKIGCGIVGGVNNSKPFGIYVIGEGFISKDQIEGDPTKYISIEMKKTEEGLKSGLRIDGEYIDVTAENTGVVKFEDGKLTAGIENGYTKVIFKKDGKDDNPIEVFVENHNGQLTLDIPNKSLEIDGHVDATIANTVTIEGNVDGKVGLTLDGESAKLNADGSTADVNIKVKDKEILDAEMEVEKAEVSIGKNGASAELKTSQKATLFQRLSAKLSERAKASINKERADVSVGGDVEVNDKQIASGDAGLGYEYATDTGTASIKASALGNEVVNTQKDFNPATTLKTLLSKLMKK